MEVFPEDAADLAEPAPGSRALPKRFRRNVLTGYLRTGSAAVISLVMTPVLLDGLGTEAFGVWVVVGSLVFYREFLEFGLAAATPKYVAEFAALGDRERLRTSIATSFWLLMIPSLLALALGLGLAAVFPAVFHVSPALHDASQLLVVIIAIDFALAIPGDAFSGVLVGAQRYDIMNISFVVVNVLQTAAIVAVLVAGGGLVALGIVTVVISVAGQVWRYRLARRVVPELSLSPRSIDRDFVRPLTGLSIWLGIGKVANLVLLRMDTLVVGAVLGVEAAAVYAVGQKLILVIWQLTVPLGVVFFPHSSELAAQSDDAGLRRSLILGTRIQLAVAVPLALATAIMAGPLLEAWVGSGFDTAVPVVAFLAAAVTIWAASSTGSSILEGTGGARAPALIRGSEAILHLGLSIALAHLVGLEGVALGALLAAVATNLIVLFPYACRQFGVRRLRFVGSLVAAHAPPAAAALAVGLLLAQADPTTIPAALAAAAAIAGVYLVVLWITGVDRSERREVIIRLRDFRSRAYAGRA